jgi:hypothetical protein
VRRGVVGNRALLRALPEAPLADAADLRLPDLQELSPNKVGPFLDLLGERALIPAHDHARIGQETGQSARRAESQAGVSQQRANSFADQDPSDTTRSARRASGLVLRAKGLLRLPPATTCDPVPQLSFSQGFAGALCEILARARTLQQLFRSGDLTRHLVQFYNLPACERQPSLGERCPITES